MRIAVTRPAPQGEATARMLVAGGHQVILAPLMILASLPTRWPEPVDAVLATSANALRRLPDGKCPYGQPLFAVGEATAEAARSAGFADVRIGSGDAAGLAGRVRAAMPADARLAYLAGRVRKPDLERMLADTYRLSVLETYDMRPAATLPGQLAAALGDDAGLTVLHYSQATAATFAALARSAGLVEGARRARHICLSADVARGLASLAPRDVRTATAASEAALLRLIDRSD